MGYTTTFEGAISVTPALSKEEVEYINKFSSTRRFERPEGGYYVGGESGDFISYVKTPGVNYNNPPAGQPGLWCQWVASEDGTRLEWDGGEKFYEAERWMSYLVHHFLKPDAIAKQLEPESFGFLQGHALSGVIYAVGEDSSDLWRLQVDGERVFYQELNKSQGGLKRYVQNGEKQEAQMMEKLEQVRGKGIDALMQHLEEMENLRCAPYFSFMKSGQSKWRAKVLVEPSCSEYQIMQLESIRVAKQLVNALKDKKTPERKKKHGL